MNEDKKQAGDIMCRTGKRVNGTPGYVVELLNKSSGGAAVGEFIRKRSSSYSEFF